MVTNYYFNQTATDKLSNISASLVHNILNTTTERGLFWDQTVY